VKNLIGYNFIKLLMRIMTDTVELVCVNDKNRLRVRIISPGYLPNANCQFPRQIRQAGRKFRVQVSDIQLITRCNQWFYSVRRGAHIEVVNDQPPESQEQLAAQLKDLKVYEDATTDDCVICSVNKKNKVFVPCGHYYTCDTCASKVFKEDGKIYPCPICRQTIKRVIDKRLIVSI
jgi:hypothetical protein